MPTELQLIEIVNFDSVFWVSLETEVDVEALIKLAKAALISVSDSTWLEIVSVLASMLTAIYKAAPVVADRV